MLTNLYFLLTTGTTVDLSGAETTQSTVVDAAGATVDAAGAVPDPGAGLFGIFGTVGYLVLIFGAMYFLMIRPQRKREKKAKEMRSALRVGDNVLTSSGMYGKIVDIGGDVFIVEFGTIKGIRIPVSKVDVVAVREPKLTRTDFDDDGKNSK